MPLAFEDLPGLQGDQLRLARQGHSVIATGPALALATMVPSLRSTAIDAHTISFDLREIQLLLVGTLRPAANFPRSRKLHSAIIHATRMGVALDRIISSGVDTSPCSASVARCRFLTAATADFGYYAGTCNEATRCSPSLSSCQHEPAATAKQG